MPRTYEPIASQTLGSGASTVTFSSIPGTFTDLIIVSDFIMSAASGDGPSMRFNSDTGSNYSSTLLYGDSGGAASARSSSASAMTYVLNANTSSRGLSSIQVLSYANTNVYKTVLAGYSFGTTVVARTVGLWRSTSAITSITLADLTPDNFATGSTFALYGIKAA